MEDDPQRALLREWLTGSGGSQQGRGVAYFLCCSSGASSDHPAWRLGRPPHPHVRDGEELSARRRVETSDETVWRCVLKLGPRLTRTLRRLWSKPIGTGHLDEVIAWIGGKTRFPQVPWIGKARGWTCSSRHGGRGIVTSPLAVG